MAYHTGFNPVHRIAKRESLSKSPTDQLSWNCRPKSSGFVPRSRCSHNFVILFFLCYLTCVSSFIPTFHIARPGQSATSLHLFEFFRERSQEGFAQLKNLGDAAQRGQLTKGLLDISEYTRVTNQKLAQGLAASRNQLLKNVNQLFTGASSDDWLEELGDILVQADLGTQTALEIVNEVASLQETRLTKMPRDDLMSIMRGKIVESLVTELDQRIRFSHEENIPTVLFIMGSNGMGKTTTIGKLAHRLKNEGNQTVLLAACDTFRAGAVDQLQQWADRASVDMVGPTDQANSPSAVLYNALDRAVRENYDTLLVDTSGRLSNNDALTAELAKMKNVIKKRLSTSTDADGKPVPNRNVPHETLLVLDAAQGRMAADSAQVWYERIGLTGLILTKLDGTARGGSVVAISRDLKLPVKLIGVGEGIDDLQDFDPESFVDSLLGIGEAGAKSVSAKSSAMFAYRLTELRKERDARAATVKEDRAAVAAQPAPPKSVAPPRSGSNPNRPKTTSRKGKRKK